MRYINYLTLVLVSAIVRVSTAQIVEIPPPEIVVAGVNGVVITQSRTVDAGQRDGSDFGRQIVNPSGFIVKSFLITNYGSENLHLTSLTVDGPDAHTAFDFTDPAPTDSIPAGAFAYLHISLRPTTAGTKSATVHINSNDPIIPVFSFDVTATVADFGPAQFHDVKLTLKSLPRLKLNKKTGMYSVQCSLNVTNAGTIPTPEGSIVSLAHSFNLLYEPTDPVKGSAVFKSIKPGKSKTVKLKYNAAAIPQFMFAEVKLAGLIHEEDRLNNIISIQPGLP